MFLRSVRTVRPKRRTAGCKLLLCAALSAAFPVRASAADLTTMDLEQLLELTVIGAAKYKQKQSEVAASVSIISRREIKAFGWRTLEEALASLPGVYSTYDRQYAYLGTRGFGLPGDFSTRVLVNVNGNRLNDPTYDAGPFGRSLPLDMDLVDRIEFIPGPGGAVYGQNAMFGVVNVITRNGADLAGTELALAHEGPQALREGRASWGTKFDGGLDALVSVSGLRARGKDLFYDYGDAGVAGVASGLDGEHDKELFVRLGYGRWSLEHLYGNHRKDDPTGAYRSDPLVPGSFQGDRYALTQLRYESASEEDSVHLSGRLFVGSESYRSRQNFDTPFLSNSNTRWDGVEFRAVSTALANH